MKAPDKTPVSRSRKTLYVFNCDGEIVGQYSCVAEYSKEVRVNVSSLYYYVYNNALFRGELYLSHDKNAKVIFTPAEEKTYYIFERVRTKNRLAYVASSKQSCFDYVFEKTEKVITTIENFLNDAQMLICNKYLIFDYNAFPLSEEEKKINLEYHNS